VVWLILSPLAVGNRTGLLATSAAISGYAIARYKAKALPVIAGLFLLGVAVFVFVPQLRGSTFYNEDSVEFSGVLRGEIDTSNIDSSGRFAMWEDLLDRFYEPDPLMGSGLGSVQEHLYSKAMLEGGLSVAHSDYVTLLCDTGLVGLVLYLATSLSALGLALKYIWTDTVVMEIRVASALVLAALTASLCATGFDNVFNYTLPVHSLPFAFTGILLGMVSSMPCFAMEDPWLWSRQYIWSRLLRLRGRGYQAGLYPQSMEANLYPPEGRVSA
jgi:O-antigen ligase